MKLKVLLVDDEPKVLKGIKTIIDRSNENWDVVGECKNGIEALEAISKENPDVVITDIKMPCMDGLELVERVKLTAPDLKFIILSGFPDFSYAQQAIRLETVDYILKPPDYRDILKSIKKVELQKREQETRIKEEEELKSFKKEALVQLRDKFFQEALYKTDVAKIQQHINGVEGFEVFDNDFALFLIKLDNFSFLVFDEAEDKLKKLEAFRGDVQKVIYKKRGCIADLYDGTYCCLLNVNNESPVYLKGMASKIHEELSKNFNDGLTIGVSRVYKGLSKTNTAYKECLYILRNKVFYEKDSIIYIGELKSESSSEGYPLELEHKYIESLRFANYEKSIEIIKFIVDKVITVSNNNPIVFKSLIMEFLIVVARSLSEARTLEISGTSIYSKLNLMDNIDDVKELLFDYTRSIVDYFNVKNKPGCRKIISDIKGYINKNYFNDITLRQISTEFFMNESYLSDLFKKEAGCSFSTYLTKVRVEQAKVLLNQMDLKPHDISEMVGYNNSRYFNKIFKKYAGLTPFEFRERILNHD